jgi:hypothetical protein
LSFEASVADAGFASIPDSFFNARVPSKSILNDPHNRPRPFRFMRWTILVVTLAFPGCRHRRMRLDRVKRGMSSFLQPKPKRQPETEHD